MVTPYEYQQVGAVIRQVSQSYYLRHIKLNILFCNVTMAEPNVGEAKNVTAKVAPSIVNDLVEDKEVAIDKTSDNMFESLLEKAKRVGVKNTWLFPLIF
jgi:hypothetical protein